MNDYIYYYTKDNKYTKTLLGEIQSEFNMSKVIDGTKDSLKVLVWSFDGKEIEPMTIIKHENTNTWWVVVHDKVERDMNESGFLYTHNLELLGAIELLNARDLTDCGFDQNTYTIWGYISRLISLSNFEFQGGEWDGYEVQSPTLDINQNVDYIKTFENYTLLSALREFLDGYNCDIKLEFNEEQADWHYGDDEYHIYSASFIIVSKTGNNVTYDESVFNDVRETKTIDKNSFGTTVVSNAENVISTKAKTYPSVGTARLQSDEYDITIDNAYLRLPSNINKINWIKVVTKANYSILFETGPFHQLSCYPYSGFSKQDMVEQFLNALPSGTTQEVKDDYRRTIEANIDKIYDTIMLANTVTLSSGWKYDPIANGVVAPNNAQETGFYFPNWFKYEVSDPQHPITLTGSLIFGTKEQREGVILNTRALYFEKGKDTINNFTWLEPYGTNVVMSGVTSFSSTDLRDSSYDSSGDIISTTTQGGLHLRIKLDISNQNTVVRFILGEVGFIVNYIPMSDLKVKYDNSGTGRDIQLYNQNGRLTDSNAFSKLLLSYSKEIETNNITKYGTYYDYNAIPSVGSVVNIGGIKYVINNVSMTFNPNESNENETHPQCYEIDCEFTLSRNIAVKSLMTNPNTDIRDYGIPQNHSVNRKQLYRDFYEFDYSHDSESDIDYYMPITKILNNTNYYQPYKDHTVVMKLGYDSPTGGNPSRNIEPQEYWYYQLNTTVYQLKKAIYEVVQFKDNNIIGYDSANSTSGFDITQVFTNTGMKELKNVPISYVDDLGKVKSFELAFCNSIQLEYIYYWYKYAESDLQGHDYMGGSFYNACVFVPKEIYEGGDIGGLTIFGAKTQRDFIISETEYNKDAIEVPVFEYSCQIDDTDNVIVGDNILDSDMEDECYMYSFAIVDKNVCNNNNYLRYAPQLYAVINIGTGVQIVNPYTANISFVDNNVKIDLMGQSIYYYTSKIYSPATLSSDTSIDTNKELAIFRHTINKKSFSISGAFAETKVDLMFVCRNLSQAPSGVVSNKSITLTTNHYKIK